VRMGAVAVPVSVSVGVRVCVHQSNCGDRTARAAAARTAGSAGGVRAAPGNLFR
jgi:hypothetical protein